MLILSGIFFYYLLMLLLKKQDHQRAAIYLAEFIVIVFLLGFYLKGFYYGNFLIKQAKLVLIILGAVYLLIVLPINLLKDNHETLFKGNVVLSVSLRFLKFLFNKNYFSSKYRFFESQEEKQKFLFFLVKIIFIPIMLNYFIMYVVDLYDFFTNLTDFSIIFTQFTWFFLLTYIIFSIDTLFFSFGYIVESKKLNNVVKSVDPSILGWLSALSCYKPFNSVTYHLFPLFTNENIFWINNTVTTLIYLMVLVFYLIFVWSTIALGYKCSNLTNRGIVSRGPYRFVRHPAYISKVLAWWIFCIPIFNLKVLISMIIWSLIYFIRAYTEERHLSADPDYINYCGKVKFRFIPYVY